MARHTGPVCRLCRREGLKLFLKGTPLRHAQVRHRAPRRRAGHAQLRRGKPSEYGIRLREKQKLKRFYGILERQFRRTSTWPRRSPGNTGDALMSLLERRLDNVVNRLGFATSRPQARQLVTHGHVTVNGRKLRHPELSGQARRHDRRSRTASTRSKLAAS